VFSRLYVSVARDCVCRRAGDQRVCVTAATPGTRAPPIQT
jgi:hypothetical protein